MPWKDLKKGKRWQAAYRKSHRKELVKAQQKRYRKYTPEIREYARVHGIQWRANQKKAAFTLYGPNHETRCAWGGCLVNDVDMLSLDHVKNDGRKHRNKHATHRGGIQFYTWLLQEAKKGRLHDIQVLCLNHNMKKEILRVRENQYLSRGNEGRRSAG